MARHRLSSDVHPSGPKGITTRTSAGLLAVTVAVSAGIHAGLAPNHLSEMPRLGEFFIVASLLGIAIALALILRPDDRRLAAIGGLFCIGQIVAWALLVTIHVPFFPGTPVAIENTAIVSRAVEAIGVGFAVGLVWPRETARAGALRMTWGRAAIARDAVMNLRVGAPMAMAALVATGVVAATASGASDSLAMSGGSTSGVTAKSITFGSYQPLTGPAATASSEITAGSHAYFAYVNAHGGVFGRKIHLISRKYANPTKVADAVRRLVQQDHVFAMFGGADTQTHLKAVSYLNESRVPDIFVGSACPCWDNGSAQPFIFGWQPSSTIEGKILGQYIEQRFPGQQVGVLYQDDAFGRGGVAGIEDEVRGAGIVTKQAYQPGVATLVPQMRALKTAGVRVLVDFTVPTYTAMGQLAASSLAFKPQLVVSNVGIDPTTVAAQLKTISKGKVSGTALINGAITDGFLPSPTARANPWIQLFRKVYARYDAGAPFDSNVVYGMASAYTLVEALMVVGKDLTRQALVDVINRLGGNWKGPGLAPFRYSTTVHGGFAGMQMGQISDGKIELFGNSLTTDPNQSDPIGSYASGLPPPTRSGLPVGTQVTHGYPTGR